MGYYFKNNMSILDATVSIFANYNTAGNPKTTTIRQFLTSTKYRTEVEAIRASNDKAERDRLKAKLPAITPSGLFSYRAADCLQQHSGLICLDIDHKGNEAIGNFFDLKTQLIKIENVAFCVKSVSGRGYAVGVPIAYPERHGQHFDALKSIFAQIGIEVDKSCRDVVRLRGYSYDDEVYLNDAAIVFTLYDVPKNDKPPKGSFTALNDNARFNELVSEICRCSIDITRDYGAWFGVGCALANELGESGRDYYHQLSQFHPKYNQTETDKQFTACMRKSGKSSTLGLVFSMAEAQGVVLPSLGSKPAPTFANLGKPYQPSTTHGIRSHHITVSNYQQVQAHFAARAGEGVPLSDVYDEFYVSNQDAAVKLKEYSIS